MNFVDIHTHNLLENGQTGIIDYPLQIPFLPKIGQYYSVGIHPWFVNKFDDVMWRNKLEKLADHPQVAAIGECGMDRVVKNSLKLQKKFFISQLEIAEEKQMPVIIHAVHTYSDLLEISKNRYHSVPWIIHGYNGNAETTELLLHKDFYFSFGASLLKNQKKLNISLLKVPFDRLFFETDESTVSIESIYKFSSELLNKSIEELQKIVLNNFNCMFAKISEKN